MLYLPRRIQISSSKGLLFFVVTSRDNRCFDWANAAFFLITLASATLRSNSRFFTFYQVHRSISRCHASSLLQLFFRNNFLWFINGFGKLYSSFIYSLQVLGIYTFTKRCILEEHENKQRKTLVFPEFS